MKRQNHKILKSCDVVGHVTIKLSVGTFV